MHPEEFPRARCDFCFDWHSNGPLGKGDSFNPEQDALQGSVLHVDGCEHRLGDHRAGEAPRQTGVGYQSGRFLLSGHSLRVW